MSCTAFEREYLSIHDNMVKAACIWRHTDKTCLKVTKLPSTQCMNVNQFEAWLRALPADTVLEYYAPHIIFPIEIGKPISDEGRDMVKVPANWVIPPYGATTKSGYVKIDMITYHPGRWKKDGTMSSRSNAVVTDGLVLVTNPAHKYCFNNSCLFAKFFNEDVSCSVLNMKLRIRQPVDMPDHEVFRGLYLGIKYTPHRGEWTIDPLCHFRATSHGETMTVNVR
jgi:hypothetical protein